MDHERRAHVAAHGLHGPASTLSTACGERLAVLLGVFQFAARVGVLVGAAKLHEHGRRARMGLFEVDLREAGVVAADLVDVRR